jgi:SAM-dependent methyltransferase
MKGLYEQNHLLKNTTQNKFKNNYEIISPEFYGNVPNILTKEKLNSLAKMTKSIEEPICYGQFNNALHYLQTLELVLDSTYETINREIFFRKKVLPLIPVKNALLDVGSGNGELLSVIARDFKHVTTVDTNEKAIEKIQKVIGANIDCTKIHGSIVDAKLTNYFYDLAVLSHMLYYIEQSKWINVVRKVYHAVNMNGLVAIVLSGDTLGKSNLIKHFGGSIPDIDNLAQKCIDTFGFSNVKIYESDESFMALNLATMLHITGFMLYDVGITADKKLLETYINEYFRYSNDYFKMTTRQKFILISKAEEGF